MQVFVQRKRILAEMSLLFLADVIRDIFTDEIHGPQIMTGETVPHPMMGFASSLAEPLFRSLTQRCLETLVSCVRPSSGQLPTVDVFHGSAPCLPISPSASSKASTGQKHSGRGRLTPGCPALGRQFRTRSTHWAGMAS